MEKIIAKEVLPSQQDFSVYFDGDCFRSTCGDPLYAVYVPPTRNSFGYNADEYKSIVKQADGIIDEFGDVAENKRWNTYATYKEVMNDYSIPYSSTKCSALKKWAETASTDDHESVAEFLTITTGKKWETKEFRGYCQGDYVDLIYCADRYSEETTKEFGKFWLGCGTEFCIDDCYGFYVIDTIRWQEDERLVKYLADLYGCKPEQLEVHLYDGEHTVADYKLLAV